MTGGKPLASIYSTHGDLLNLVIGAGMLGLAYALVRIGRPMRTIAAFITIGGASEAVGVPVGIPLFGIIAIWLGLRLIRRDDVTARLR